ncbi:MAG: sigma-70 family RNA polymerase sigma factor [Kofleriaceae bacterium]
MQQLQRDRLIAEHTEVARRIALKMARRCPTWIAREDLVAAGLLGLTEAARRYDDTRAEPFLPFAEQRIRGAVLDELRRGDMLPRRVRQAARKVAATIRSLENSGETVTDEKVAGLLGVTIEHYRDNLAKLIHVETESIDGEGAMILVDEHERPDELAHHRQTLARVRVALDKLEQRDVTLLGLHYIEEMTFQEIATTLKITASRACQLLWRAVARLRTQLGESAMRDAA